jgi:ribonuclease HIII
VYDELIAGGLIGTDEAGKGDLFGPLVCAACYINSEILSLISSAGIKDSKRLSDNSVKTLAISIKKICPHNIIVIGPEKYNQLYPKMKNLHRLLAWGHAKAIENLLFRVDCHNVLTDKFANERFVKSALQEKGKKVNLIQRTKAEMNITVAAASILARAEFLKRLESLSIQFKIHLHPGAGAPTDQALLKFLKKYGQDKLHLVAKIHFKNIKKINQ